jgi:hypothetical protein
MSISSSRYLKTTSYSGFAIIIMIKFCTKLLFFD